MLDNFGYSDLNGFDIQVMLKNNANDFFFKSGEWGVLHLCTIGTASPAQFYSKRIGLVLVWQYRLWNFQAEGYKIRKNFA